MSAAEPFHDTNVLLYLLSADHAKADRAEALIAAGGRVSVQVLNEFAAVASRRLGMRWDDIRAVLAGVRGACRVDPVTAQVHDRATRIAQRHRMGIYDACIVAAALEAGCGVLYTEDLQHGQVFERRLRVENPFLR
jgi:predicted nucleic acid-binding protein